MSLIRVCHVVETIEPLEASRAATAVAIGLSRDSFAAEVLSRRDGTLAGTLRTTGLRVRVAGGRRRDPVSDAWEACRLIAAAQPDVVHLWDDWACDFVGPVLAWQGRTPYVCSVRELPRGAPWWTTRPRRYVFRHAAAVAANDTFVAERNRSALRLREAAPWPVVVDGLLPPLGVTADRETVRAELGVPPDVPLLGTFVNSGFERDAKDVVWVAALLRNLYEELRLVIVSESAELGSLRTFCTAMDMDDRTVNVPDAARFDRIAPHLSIYVDAAYWAGPTQAIIAAEAGGVPVVAVDTPIRRRQIDVGRSGYVAPQHDRGTMTRHCHRLLSDETLRTAMGAAGSEFAATQFSLQAMLDGYAEVYRRAHHADPRSSA